MILKNSAHSLVGLAVKARKVKFGSFAAEGAIKSRKCNLVVIDDGLSEASKKKFNDMCSFHKMPLVKISEGQLERVCGKSGCMVLCIADENFARSIQERCEDECEQVGKQDNGAEK